MSENENAPDLDHAFSEIRRWYYSGVRRLVDCLIEESRDEKHEDADSAREWLTERVDEDTDGHEFVIYTFKAKCVCLASDNEDAYTDEIGEPPPTVEAQAYMAMRRDVWDLLDAREDEWLPRDCEECCVTIPGGIDPASVHESHDDECSLHPSKAPK